jgi:hypothetical protein
MCPECSSEVDNLTYECETVGWECGTIRVFNEEVDWSFDDSSTEDSNNFRFKCPDCDSILFEDLRLAETWLQAGVTEKKAKKEPEVKTDFEF